MVEIINVILYKLKTLVQWHQLLVKALFEQQVTTWNALYLTNRQGLPLAMSESIYGNDKDLYDIEIHFEVVTGTLEEADIPVEGLFLNADVSFALKCFREGCDKKEIEVNVKACYNTVLSNLSYHMILIK